MTEPTDQSGKFTIVPKTPVDWVHMASSMATLFFALSAAFPWTDYMSSQQAAAVAAFLAGSKTLFNCFAQK